MLEDLEDELSDEEIDESLDVDKGVGSLPVVVEELEEMEVQDDTQSHKGIVGEVTPYSYTNITYPYILVENLEVLQDEAILTIVAKMLQVAQIKADGTTEEQPITVYTKTSDGDMYRIGRLSQLSLRVFVHTVGLENLSGMLKEGVPLRGKNILALS